MCIVVLTTAHPDYALIVIDNRDEFILRPTSRPHWWKHDGDVDVLSARDLQRAEHGTWLGITRAGVLAVLTNYRETDANDVSHPIHGPRSRGAMVTAWLGADPREPAAETAHRLVKDGGCRGVGGFSMVCGKLRRRRSSDNDNGDNKNVEPLAIITNRSDHVDQVPWVGRQRGEIHALSNTAFEDPRIWPKVADGERLVKETIERAVRDGLDESQLVEQLYAVLDTDTLPRHLDMSLNDYVQELKHSIFVPPIGDQEHRDAMDAAAAKGPALWAVPGHGADAAEREVEAAAAEEELKTEERPDTAGHANNVGFETGMYGTQRQTIILVRWDGHVSFRERALWDGNGNPIPRGDGDVLFEFDIEGWKE